MSDNEQQRKKSASAFSGLFSPVLQMGTASTLWAESMLTHAEIRAHAAEPKTPKAMGGIPKMPPGTFPQVGLGVIQRNLGLAGMFYYGRKAYKDPSWGNLAMFTGYSGFAAHGYARMFESMEHPQKFTPRFGAMAAASKMAYPRPEFLPDLVANLAEASHSMSYPTGSWRQTAVESLKRIKPMTLLRTQRAGAVVMGAAAGLDAAKTYMRS